MLKLVTLGILIAVLSCNPVFVFGQDTLKHGAGGWTLEECIEYAKKNNIQVRSLKWNEVAGREDLLQAQASRLPLLSGSVSENVLNGKNANTTGGFDGNTNLSGNYSLNSSITLYSGGYVKNDIKEKNLWCVPQDWMY